MADKYTYFTYRFLYYIQIYNIYTWIEWNFIVLTVMWKRFIVELHYSRAQRNIITLSWYSGFLSSLYYISFSVMMLKETRRAIWYCDRPLWSPWRNDRSCWDYKCQPRIYNRTKGIKGWIYLCTKREILFSHISFMIYVHICLCVYV